MVITAKGGLIHWNYFLALESDLEAVSRYIEFDEQNYGTFSIELAHILLAAASEVDVIARQLCRAIVPKSKAENIGDYLPIIVKAYPEFSDEEIFIPRYGLRSKPWENFKEGDSPNWWKSHNKVKHERDKHFPDANLQNTINAVGGLLIAVFYFYQKSLALESLSHVGHRLRPNSNLVYLQEKYYPRRIIAG